MTISLGWQDVQGSRNGGVNQDNVIVDYQWVPPGNGWITGIAIHAGGHNGNTHAHFAIWDIAQANKLLWYSDQEAWNSGRSWRTAQVPGLRTSIDSVLRWGFWRDPLEPATWSITNDPGPNNRRHFAMTYLAQQRPPDIYDPMQSYDRNLCAYVVFERNEAPLKGVWRPPTPAGLINETTPVFSGSLPHPGASVGAMLAGDVRIDASSEAYVQTRTNSEQDLIGFAKLRDDIALQGPGEVYASQNTEHSRTAARATQRVRMSSDDIYDYSVRVRVQIRRTTDNVMVYDQMFEPTDAERSNGYFERTLATLTAGVTYAAKFQHQDSWGLWSVWSDETTIQVGAGPGQPVPSTPAGKIASGGGYAYQATYQNTIVRNANAAQIEVFNSTGATRMYTNTFTISPTIAPGAAFSVAEWHTDLPAGRSYQWRIRFRDTNGNWGTWSQKIIFRVNRAPNAPADQRPAGGRPTNNPTLQVTLSDPDNDFPTLVQVEVYNVATGLLVAGYPKTMQISADGTRASLGVGGDIALGNSYRWRARANDGLVWGEWSQYAQFLYIAIPNVTVASPSESGARNLVEQGSAFYDPVVYGDYWTEVGRVEGTRWIETVADDDAAVARPGATGVAWEAHTDGAATHYMESPMIAVQNLHHHLTGMFKTKQGNPASSFSLVCYSSGGAVLGERFPNSLGALNASTPATVWSDYGGEIWPSTSSEIMKFPTNTTQVKVRWYPSTTPGSSGIVRMDAVAFYQPLSNNSANWLLSQAFWSYVDPDSEFFSTTNDRVWEGPAGNSTSRGPAILNQPTVNIEIIYSSAQGLAKVDDKILIERWGEKTPASGPGSGGGGGGGSDDDDKKRRHRRRARRRRRRARKRRRNQLITAIEEKQSGGTKFGWIPVYATNYQNVGARTSIAIPSNVLTNENRYRLTVSVKDSNGQEGVSDPTEFDVLYEGAPELPISQIAGDPARGEIVINHARSTLDPTTFAHIEVEITDEDGETWIDVSHDQEQERYVFWAPVNGEEYRFRIRQVMLLGNDQLESRWQGGTGSVNFHPDFFLKSVKDPVTLNVPFKVPGGSLPSYTPARFRAQYQTFESDQPKGASGAPRYERGTVEMLIENTPDINADAEQKLVTLREMMDEMGVFVLLTQHPAEVRFIEIEQDGMSYGPTEYEDYTAAISYVETYFLEDYFERGGDPVM